MKKTSFIILYAFQWAIEKHSTFSTDLIIDFLKGNINLVEYDHLRNMSFKIQRTIKSKSLSMRDEDAWRSLDSSILEEMKKRREAAK